MAKNAAQPAVSQWRNRIVGQADVAPQELEPSPFNWRQHPTDQREAMAGALRELGWIQQIVVNQRSGRLIDGHLRLSLAVEHEIPLVPVLYVDLSEEEEQLALATLDPLAALAEADTLRLRALLETVQSSDPAVQAMLSQLAESTGIVPPHPPEAPEAFPTYDEDIATQYCCPKCGYAWSGQPQ